jgi:Domain of unknown function (DUF4397)
MKLPQKALRLVMAAALVMSAGLLSTVPAWASPGAGWVRLAHLSPNTPPVDVYLYSFGDPSARLVLRHVSYGVVSPYQEIPAGDYTVSMRAAGAPPTSPPVLSTTFWVSTGDAYTVAGMGPASGLRLKVLKDTLAVPAGRALVRVIQASLRQHVVSVTFGGLTLTRALEFGSTTPYRVVTAGTQVVRVTGNGDGASLDLSLPADTIHTLVVLDGPGGLRISDLEDAAGSQVQPSGGVATGLGGTAPRPARSLLPWLTVIAVGVLLAGAGARQYRQIRLAGSRAR